MRRILLRLLACLASSWPVIALGHPGALSEYPERFPGKTLQYLVSQWEPAFVVTLSADDLLAQTCELGEGWSETPADELKLRIQDLIEKNRQGDYRKRVANALNDMLDLLSNGDVGHSAEAADYVRWRLSHLDADDGYFDELAAGHWDESKEQANERTRKWSEERDRDVGALGAKADSASHALRPHWLVQCGALEFKHLRFPQAAGYFQRVLEAFPQHPRAEIATLMLARVKLEEWKQNKRNGRLNSNDESRLLQETWQALQHYSDRFADGRFAIDITGWEAGINRENGNLGQALEGYLLQAGQTGHPEVRRRAFQQIEWMLRDLTENPGELEALPWEKIAAEPVVALRIGYFMLDAMSETDLGALMFRRSGEDHRVLESLAPTLAHVRAAATKGWPALERALEGRTNAYRGDRTAIREVLHAWSAVIRGEPSLALAGLAAKHEGLGADDVLMVRAAAWIKAERHAEALRALDELEQHCPDSVLLRGINLRRADAWIHLGQSATALPLLWKLLEGDGIAITKSGISDSPPLILPGEIAQRLSALLSFAPLAQLEQAQSVSDASPLLHCALSGALRIRYLSEWRFDESLKFAEAPDFDGWVQFHRNESPTPEQAAMQWRESIELLRNLSDAVGHAGTNDAKAAAWIALGHAWEHYLWRLLDGGAVYLAAPYNVALLPGPTFELRHHASLLHLTDEAASTMLDLRQETTHAIRCYEAALHLAPKGGALSLSAMLSLQGALRTRAEFSPYFMDRAVEKGDEARSRTLHDRIKTEHPQSADAARAVWWTFRPSRTLGVWQPGGSALFGCEARLAALLGGTGNSASGEDDWRMQSSLKDLNARLKQALDSEVDVSKLRLELTAIRETTRREVPSAKAGPLLNHLDDLELLLTIPNLNPSTLSAYAAARLEGRSVNTNDAVFADIKDFTSFWNDVVTPSTQPLTAAEQEAAIRQPDRGARQRVAQAQVSRMTAFLEEFPKSAKREAALARLAINTLRQYRPHCGMASGYCVESASTAYAGFEIERGIAFDYQAVKRALDNYDREFPSGRYQWDLRLIRGTAASEAKDWPSAISQFVTILDHPEKRDLHLDASNNLGAIFMELFTPENRMAVMEAIKQTPGAWDKLDLFMHSPTCGWRLRVLDGWLQAQR